MALVTTVVIWLDIPRASACTCASTSAAVLWPRDEAQDVAINTPIVIARQHMTGSAEDVHYVVVDQDGVAVPLQEVRELRQRDACHGEVLFLQSQSALAPNSAFTVRFTLVAGTETQDLADEATFMTGDSTSEPEDDLDVTFDYVHIAFPEPCTGPACIDVADVRFDLSIERDSLHWVVLETTAVERGYDQLTWWPAMQHANPLPLVTAALPRGDRCIELRVYGIEGRELFYEERCTPDACLIFDQLSLDSCGGPPIANVEPSTAGSCDDPPVVEAPVGTDAGQSEAIHDGGCSASQPRLGMSWIAPGLWALVCLRNRRRRRG